MIDAAKGSSALPLFISVHFASVDFTSRSSPGVSTPSPDLVLTFVTNPSILCPNGARAMMVYGMTANADTDAAANSFHWVMLEMGTPLDGVYVR